MPAVSFAATSDFTCRNDTSGQVHIFAGTPVAFTRVRRLIFADAVAADGRCYHDLLARLFAIHIIPLPSCQRLLKIGKLCAANGAQFNIAFS